MNKHTAGHLAETFAGIYFLLKGYRILARNYITGRGTHAGEIDFIAARGRTIVFVEVKKRQNLEAASYALRESQKQRIRKAAETYLSRRPQYQNYDVRFDAVLVRFPCFIKVIRNAF